MPLNILHVGPDKMRVVSICFIHHADGAPVDKVQAAAPWEGTHYLLRDCPDIDSLLDPKDPPPPFNAPKFTVIRGKEMAWLCTNPYVPEMAAYIIREQKAKGDEVEVFLTDSPEHMRHYVKTGEAIFSEVFGGQLTLYK